MVCTLCTFFTPPTATMHDRSSSTSASNSSGFWTRIRSASSATLGGRRSSFQRWLRRRRSRRPNDHINTDARNRPSRGLLTAQRSPWMRRSRRIPREYEEEHSRAHTSGTMLLRPGTSSRPLAEDDPFLSFSGISPWDRSLYEERTLEHSVLHDLNMTYLRRNTGNL